MLVRGLDRAHFQKEPPLGVVTQSTQFSVALWRVVSDSQRMERIGERGGLALVLLMLCAALVSFHPSVASMVLQLVID